jgi:DNA-binding response OmpR family regulator
MPRLRATPVLVLTPEISPAHYHEGTRTGCHAWLARPTVAEDLVAVIGEVIDQANAQAQPQPRSFDAALLGANRSCPACKSTRLRAALRISPVQYYRCMDCGFYWRVEMLPVGRSA